MLGLVQVESNFRKYAVSVAGARGYMQVMPFWARLIGDGDRGALFHMQTNLRYGCVILRHYLDLEQGRPVHGARPLQRQPRPPAVSRRSTCGLARSLALRAARTPGLISATPSLSQRRGMPGIFGNPRRAPRPRIILPRPPFFICFIIDCICSN